MLNQTSNPVGTNTDFTFATPHEQKSQAEQHWSTHAIQEIVQALQGGPTTVKTVAAASHLLEGHHEAAFRQLGANVLNTLLQAGEKVPIRITKPDMDLSMLIEQGQQLNASTPGLQKFLLRTPDGFALVDHP
ncbi:MAG TPA: hypothetical protein VFV43_05935 [Limnobacter sp.]|nr:hypothetical protein [Limnobacter sp.]